MTFKRNDDVFVWSEERYTVFQGWKTIIFCMYDYVLATTRR